MWTTGHCPGARLLLPHVISWPPCPAVEVSSCQPGCVSQASLSNWKGGVSLDCRDCLDLSLLLSSSIFFFSFFFLLGVKIEDWTDSAVSGCSYNLALNNAVSISSLKSDGRILFRVSREQLF